MTQPEALRLADWLLDWLRFNAEPSDLEAAFVGAAAELRRLHAVVQAKEDECETHSAAVYEATRLLAEAREQRAALLEALQLIAAYMNDPMSVQMTRQQFAEKAKAAIIKAEGKT